MESGQNQLELIGLLLLLGWLFILETESIISLLYFVSLLLILIFNLLPIYYSNYSYFSYMIIIIYLSALVILFTYVIFLSNPETFRTKGEETLNNQKKKEKTRWILPLLILSVVIITCINSTWTNIEMPTFQEDIWLLNFKPDILDSIGILLYEQNRILLQFLLITILLFITLIGIILLLT